MKYKIFAFFCLLFVCFFTMSINIKAINTGFTTEEIEQEKIDSFLSDLEITLLTSPPTKKSIQCFDVNENNMIAVHQKGYFDDNEICVYSSFGEFLYGYKFNTYGDIVLEWDKKNINILFIRSNFIVSVNENGKVPYVNRVKETQENYHYKERIKSKTQQVVGDLEYLVQKNIGIFAPFTASNSQIIVKHADGKENMIYDVNSEMLFNMIVKTIFAVIFVSIAITIIVRQSIKVKRTYNNRTKQI